MFDKVLIANRAEIAVRVARTLRELDVSSVAVYSDVDASSLHVAIADEAVHLPGASPADTYLNIDAVLGAALSRGADAIHPGYGFLSENADFADAVIAAGLAWIGPPPEAARALGDKIRARNLARSAGVPVVPGSFEPIADPEDVVAFAGEHGYPVAVKAAGGGGGRGLKVARAAEDVERAWRSARREADAYFASGELYAERYLDAPKHLEVQILAPDPDTALWLGVRDCSMQRRHQKIIEETPPPVPVPAADMGAAAVALSKACGYVGAGTVEMLVDADGRFYFLEVNARLQVEHTVTEEVTGIDLVAAQLRIAAGEPLGFTQGDVDARGHALECRVNSEDPARAFAPAPGLIRSLTLPAGPGVRVDAGYRAGDAVPEQYDSLMLKVITYAPTREGARRRMVRALGELEVDGVPTTVPVLGALLESDDFRAGTYSTVTVEHGGVLDTLAPAGVEPEPLPSGNVLLVDGHAVNLWHPAMSAAASAAVADAGSGDVVAPMHGTIVEVLVAPGDAVVAGAPVAVLEAMKMETTLVAPVAGTVAAVPLGAGDTAPAGGVVARIS